MELLTLIKKTYINLNANVERSSYRSLKDLIFPVSSKAPLLPEDIPGDLRGHVNIKGYVDDLNIIGEASGKEIDILGENISNIKSAFFISKRYF